MANDNKVRFGLKNVHYAVMNTSGYGTPVAIPGAVNLDLSASGELTKFYADNVAYYVSNGNQGYEGSLEIAAIPDAMLKDVFGYTEGSTSKVLTEDATVEPKAFALLYQIDGDQDDEDYVLYNVAAGRPSIGSKTIEDNKEPVTQSFNISAVPRSDGKVFAKTTKDTPTATKSTWFTTVFVESAE
jgi:phi13 family phage major tail protein